MTQSQRAVYEAILDLIERNGISPSTREIADAVGYASTSTVHRHLCKLRAMGYITFTDKWPRTIRVTACYRGAA